MEKALALKALSGKNILLIVGGGIAAYKSLELARRLRESGAKVQAILTPGGREFVTPLSLATLSGAPVREELFDASAESDSTGMSHIELARFGDVVIVAPASANLIARMASGAADDLAAATLLASDAPLLLAPAMNPNMWSHPATQRNLARLLGDGVGLVGPNEGDTACGDVGVGRMAEVDEILRAAASMVAPAHKPLAGRRALVNAGPTFEAIDSLRYITNRSSGRQGHAIASALAQAGADTLLVRGPCGQPAPKGVETLDVESATQMFNACTRALPVDVAVMTAAVGDWRMREPFDGKIRKRGNNAPVTLELVENPDILAELSKRKDGRPELVVGFAAESGDAQEVLAYARAKRERKGCDWIVANSIDAMGSENTRLQLVTSNDDSFEEFTGDKRLVARRLVDRIAERFAKAS